MPWVIAVVAPGFEPDGPRYDAAVELSRITFCYILFISLVALQGGVLNSLGPLRRGGGERRSCSTSA